MRDGRDGQGTALDARCPTSRPTAATWRHGKVVIRAHGIADKDRKDVRYVFEITNAAGDKETSEPVEAGERANVASWTPKMAVKAGEEYTWRVWAVAGDWKGPAITATFKGKSAG